MNSAGMVGKDLGYGKRSVSGLDLSLELLTPEADHRRNQKREGGQLTFIEHLLFAALLP